MLSKLTCPECEKVLKPAKPIPEGKKVKCPDCKQVFIAGEDGRGGGRIQAPQDRMKSSGKPAVGGKTSPKKKPAKTKPEKKKADKDEKELLPMGDSIPLAPMDDDEDDGPATYALTDDFDAEEEAARQPKINYAPDESIKDLRGPAQEAVIKPTNFMLRNGVAGFLGWLALLTIILIPILFPVVEEGTEANPIDVLALEGGFEREIQPPSTDIGGFGGSGAPKIEIPKEEAKSTFFSVAGMDFRAIGEFRWYLMILWFSPFIVGMVWSGLVAYGSIKAQNLESRPWGIASSILCMIPVTPIGLIIVKLMFLELLASMFIDDWSVVDSAEIGVVVIGILTELLIGIWLLLTLLRQEVVDGFDFIPESEGGELFEDEEDEDDEEDDEYDDDDYDDEYDDEYDDDY